MAVPPVDPPIGPPDAVPQGQAQAVSLPDLSRLASNEAWRWGDKRMLMLLHDESLAEHGGASGLRDEGLLDSALMRPVNRVAYGGEPPPDVAELAAAYGHGLAQNHPFVDGNKRAAFLAVGLFLALNGWRLTASQAEATVAMFELAAGELDEPAFAAWLRQHLAPRGPR
jgi:death-on-curing protein